ncbi:IAA-leucine-resistant (ILR1)-like 3 [Actinidia rufa]|uniref:IAA-leucine-resistant (ILR1)-like 3 n=1 Tax=Actinidia rufa TaxID=165716 RepID=A0A7J0EC13_9ERIC|nr:IAA-leucine-resistant (ILR1)-like 3 [Actinidia rufa]
MNGGSFGLTGTVRLLFQPAEEGGAGASHMIKEGALGDAEAIFGMHIDSSRSTGSIAKPHTSVDPILAASFVILALQQLISREVDPLQSQVVSVTYVRGGTAWNIIPPYVELGGTLRSLTTAGLHQLQKRLKEVIQGQAAVHRCNAHVAVNNEWHPPYPATVNDEGLHQHVKRVGGLMLGPENVELAEKRWVPFTPLTPPHFFLDEDVLPIGAALHAALAEMYINDHQESVVP